jgi:nitroreductase
MIGGMVATHIDADLLELLRTRRSVPRVASEEPPRRLIEQVIEAAGWAPNHYKTEPWRFVVLTGKARERLGDAMAASLRRRMPSPDAPEARALLDKERSKPTRAPVVIVAAVEPSSLPKAREIEEIEAGAAGVENMLLAAHALGLATMWRTGDAAYDPEVKRFLGFAPTAHIVAFIYLGYPDVPALPPRERDLQRFTRWRSDED